MAEPTPTPVPASPADTSDAFVETPPASEPGLAIQCQCGYITLRTATPRPLWLAHCHCTDCRKQSGSAFGASAYFPPGPGFYPLPPDIAARVGVYTRPTDSGNTMHCYFCPRCGVRLLHAVVLPDGSLRPALSVKAGCIEDPERVIDWSRAKHIFTRSAVTPLVADWETYEVMPPQPPPLPAAAAATLSSSDGPGKAETD
ncbi:Mss4-like protein [Niveomyces insectorum RCEF 264]|uniref:Mss4-like protein n=1 Tax=Niveomyces insectorum RCEF 264 TaxID=1081102 RepID=A0A167XYW5_9HYPO|nr:Mss4-like protein [Niveomyces insectorum RCEF 264]